MRIVVSFDALCCTYSSRFALKDGQLWLGHQQALMVSKSISSIECVCRRRYIILLDTNHVFTGTHFFGFCSNFRCGKVWLRTLHSLLTEMLVSDGLQRCVAFSSVDFVYYVEPVSLK